MLLAMAMVLNLVYTLESPARAFFKKTQWLRPPLNTNWIRIFKVESQPSFQYFWKFPRWFQRAGKAEDMGSWLGDRNLVLKLWPLITDTESLGLLVYSIDFWVPSRFTESKSLGVGHRICSKEETKHKLPEIYMHSGVWELLGQLFLKYGPPAAAASPGTCQKYKCIGSTADLLHQKLGMGSSSLHSMRLQSSWCPLQFANHFSK